MSSMQEHRFRQRLEQEFRMRREKNPRYSLRSFARFLGADHSVISQILRAIRRTPPSQIRKWGRKLKMSPEEAAAYIAAEHLPDAAETSRLEQLRHWTAEGLSLATTPVHWQILRLSRMPGFHADCRWLAKKINVSVDEVNLALARLLRLRLLQVGASGRWKDLTGARNEREFRKLALVRIREKAAEATVDSRE
ncbi:MAG: DUF4423 domain-containing protein [Acidobacteriia bacterium]|nr:DUF4423 domain-containing protein [Terriglobia bacterium]